MSINKDKEKRRRAGGLGGRIEAGPEEQAEGSPEDDPREPVGPVADAGAGRMRSGGGVVVVVPVTLDAVGKAPPERGQSSGLSQYDLHVRKEQ